MTRSGAIALLVCASAAAPLTLACGATTDHGSPPILRKGESPAGPLPAPAATTLPFSATSFWRTPLPAGAPVDSQSDALVQRLSADVAKRGSYLNTTQYTPPVYQVPAGQPTVRVTLDANDSRLQADFAAVPLPPDAHGSTGTDASAVVWQPATDTLWEFWRLRKAADGFHARWGGRIANVSSSDGIFPAPYGAAASGLSQLGGLIRVDEFRAGAINHVLGLGVPDITSGAVRWPATRTDGMVAGGGIPMGTRFRLPASIDVTKLGLPPAGVVIARAIQRYGLVVTDTAGCVCLAAEPPVQGTNSWPALLGGAAPWALLQRFPWDRLEVLSVGGLRRLQARVRH